MILVPNEFQAYANRIMERILEREQWKELTS